MNTSRRFFLFPMGLLLIAGVSTIVMLLWNWLAPEIFGLSTISFWQALGLLILSRLLFGGFSRGWGGKMAAKEHMHSDRNPIRETWMNMTPEERKSFAER